MHERVHVMGILNVTPDSFSDGGLYADTAAAVRRATQMVDEGADLIDVGGESTRPGASPAALSEELERVIPVIAEVVDQTGVAVSVDTTKSEVARAALDAGAEIVNDVSALRFDPEMTGVVAESGAGVVLMHMLGEPRTMQDNPVYGDVVAEVRAALLDWAEGAEARGIKADRIVIDPGIGFGKTREHNLTLLKSIGSLTDAGYPVMVGPSRKSFIGTTLNLPVDDRLEGTAAVVAWVVAEGARIVRVHDVGEITRVVRMIEAIKSA
ncbi:MAG TPA: dihydropteroate synthase [Actinomycetota bacterium]|nr:dihydropteroate synthase [Actinomycetota bacterium]